MKLQEVERSAIVAWSPVAQYPAYLASGTVAGSLDKDFDTSAHLEIFQIDFANKAQMKVVGTTTAVDRFNKVCWGSTGVQNGTFPRGLLAGALANGTVNIWNPEKIIGRTSEAEDDDPALIACCERHAPGPVLGLDFNPFQHSLLASGGNDSEIFIWDLQNPANPTVYNPGAKQQVYQDSGITCVQWNRKVQHILGSTNYSGVTVVWDLKAKRAVLSFSSPNRKLRCKAMAWNPEESTQILTASEDDSAPIIELWDLRNTYSPVKVLDGHTRGVWSVSWCPMDSDLLLSCGKDNRTLCWNVRTGEIQSEVEVNAQTWNTDVQWSPRIPAILSTCSLERKISIYSLQDVRNNVGVDKSLGPLASAPKVSQPPKWLKRPAGASFGFGGKVVWFKKLKQQNEPKKVFIHQVVTDKDLLARADRLEEALVHNDLTTFCDEKISSVSSEDEKSTWKLLKMLFEQNPRRQLLQHLGFNHENISQEIKDFVAKMEEKEKGKEAKEKPAPKKTKEEPKQSTDEKDVSGLFGSESADDSVFENLQSPPEDHKEEVVDSTPVQFFTEGTDGMVTKALIIGNFEDAVQCCIQSGRMADALILAAYGGQELWKKTQEAYFKQKAKEYMRVASSIIKEELRTLVTQADLKQWKALLAVICTYAKREEFPLLASLLGDRILNEGRDAKSASECYICAGNIDKLLQVWSREKHNKAHNAELQNLVEKVAVFRKAVNHHDPLDESVADKFSEYAQLLASQGRLVNALGTLSFLTEAKYEDTSSSPFVLLDRLFHATNAKGIPAPPFPFQRVQVTPSATVPGAPTTQPRPVQNQLPTRPATGGPTPASYGGTQFPTANPATGFQSQTGGPRPTPTYPGPTPTGPLPGQFVPTQPTPVPTSSPRTAPPPVTTPSMPPTMPSMPTMTPTMLTMTPSMPTMTPSMPAMTPSGMMPHGTTSMPLGGPPPVTPSPVSPPSMRPMPTPVSPPTPAVVGPPPPITATASPSTPESRPTPKPYNSDAPTQKQGSSTASSGPTSPENQRVIDSLNNILNQCNASTDPKINKYAKDVQARFKPMLDKLAKNDATASVTQALSELCQAILAGDHRTASNVHITLTQQHWEELGSSLMIGLKRLLEITKN